MPGEAEFSECVNWFYAAAIMGARCIVRNEPWQAKVRDSDAKMELLKMIEWDHRARYGQDFHTWFLGKHLDQWMDSHVREALDRCWRAFPVAEGRAALIATLELYDRLALRTAEALGLSRPPIDGPRAEVARMLATHDPLTGRFIGLVTRRAPDGREPPPLTDPGQRVEPAGVVRVEARSTAPIHVTSRALWRSAA